MVLLQQLQLLLPPLGQRSNIMPLIQSGSEEALRKNIATEIRAGKDPEQAAAIAYSIQRGNDTEMPQSIVKDEIAEINSKWESK